VRDEALAWFNDATVSIADKVAVLHGPRADLPNGVTDVLDQLDRWWGRRSRQEREELMIRRRGDELDAEYQQMVTDANEGSPAIVAIVADHPGGRFRLPTMLAVYLELKDQEG
jgi:hypothetical protein